MVDKYIKRLAVEIFPFIENSEKANNVNLLANQVNAAYLDMDSMISKLIEVFNKDMLKFSDISTNIDHI